MGCVASVRVVGDAIFDSADEIFEGVDGSFVTKGDCKGGIRVEGRGILE